jgi:hypothetical protein
MVRREWSVALTLLLCALMGLPAADVGGELTLSHTLSYSEGGGYQGHFAPDMELSLTSPGSGNVRSEIRIRIPPSGAGTGWDEYIRSAYLRARLPHVRLTAGKSVLTWGDGFLFNAADVPTRRFDRRSAPASSDALWMAGLYIPVGAFDFVEVVALPSLGASDVGGALRLYMGRWAVKTEAGYHYKEGVHTPYVSLQGHLGLDWWLSSSLDISNDTEEVRISGGLFHTIPFIGGAVLSLRAEALGRPIGPEEGVVVAVESTYAPAQSRHYTLGATYATHSALLSIALGVSITPLEALTLGGAVTIVAEGWRFASAAATISASWLF